MSFSIRWWWWWWWWCQLGALKISKNMWCFNASNNSCIDTLPKTNSWPLKIMACSCGISDWKNMGKLWCPCRFLGVAYFGLYNLGVFLSFPGKKNGIPEPKNVCFFKNPWSLESWEGINTQDMRFSSFKPSEKVGLIAIKLKALLFLF